MVFKAIKKWGKKVGKATGINPVPNKRGRKNILKAAGTAAKVGLAGAAFGPVGGAAALLSQRWKKRRKK